MQTTDRIAGQLVQIEVEEVEGFGWVAMGVIQGGLDREQGCSSRPNRRIRWRLRLN